ncbi:MAG: hypothetical protein R3E39_29735 [Anaerolineae bacterium]
MTRIWLLVASGLSVLFLLALQLGTKPRDGVALKELLFSTVCSELCFMDIYPGTTTFYEAHNILENNPWVASVELIFRAPDAPLETRNGSLRWRWNGLQPKLLHTPSLDAGEVDFENGIVHSIKVATSVSFGDAWLLLGQPAHGFIGTSRIYLGRFDNHVAVYNEQGIQLQTLLPHAPRIATFWNALVDVIFEPEPPEQQLYRLPCWLRCE